VNVLVVNAGSSSFKVRLLNGTDGLVATQDLPPLESTDLTQVLRTLLDEHPEIDAIGHRVVHGGSSFIRPIRLDEGVDAALEGLQDLAPLHNPPSLAAIAALASLQPGLPQVACFDTAFHADMPAKAATYAVPREWRTKWDIRRYGFHGLSHAYASRRAAELLRPAQEPLRLVTAHIGAGASLAAVVNGRSVDTTMGFTPMEGLVMATRSGSVDPGLILWVQRHGGLSPDEIESILEHDSGLRGLTGGSGDLRQLSAAMDAGDADARLAYEVYVYRIQTSVAAMTAAMGGLEALVFTGGVGENAPRLRADVGMGLEFLGVRIMEAANATAKGDSVVSPTGAQSAVVVVAAREDLEIARHVRELLQ
jgi:acetate kinase